MPDERKFVRHLFFEKIQDAIAENRIIANDLFNES